MTRRSVTPTEFCALHVAALERDEARHMMMLGVIQAAGHAPPETVRFFSFGAPAACAILAPNGVLMLGELATAQCDELAEQVARLNYKGVIGPDANALRFVERARMRGGQFLDPMPQRTHTLAAPPCYPGAPGAARRATVEDADLLTDWMAAFVREATPHDEPPARESLAEGAAAGRYYLWTVDGEPVSTAAIVRRTRHGGGIAAVFTPAALRGRGYAGSVTAAAVDALFAEGKTMACLNTDLRNPMSNRCYAKIGFIPVCDTMFFPRRLVGSTT